MKRQMDGQEDGWVDNCMGGWTWWIDGMMDGQIDGWLDGLI